MKKTALIIVMLVAIAVLAAVDYVVNAPLEKSVKLSADMSDEQSLDSYTNIVQMLLDENPSQFDYVIYKRNRVKQLFEKFDMSSLENVVMFKSILDKKAAEGETPAETDRLIVYEIQGPQNQGKITYLNLKLKLIDQLDASGSINEVSGYGYNSFFYNDLNNESTGFLLAQIKDNLFGFQYNKSPESKSFDNVKNIVEALKSLNLLT
jgi:hypothetical protein